MKQLVINRNETLQGPSPRCLQVLKNFPVEKLVQYEPGYYQSRLVPALAKKFHLPEEQVIVSYGAEDFLRYIFNQLKPNEPVLTGSPSYVYYDKYTKFRNIPLATFTMRETHDSFVYDIDDCLTQYKKIHPKLLLITSPNNPTGNSLTIDGAKKILSAASPDTVIVIDEAYEGFNPKYPEKEFLKLLDAYPNLVLVRTFSKRYALAGLRIGYALCGKNVKAMLNYQAPYLGMSRLLEEIGLAALASTKYYDDVRREIITIRDEFIAKTNTLKNFRAYQSHANFVAVHVNQLTIKTVEKLLTNIPVLPAKFVLPGLLRVSIGLPRHMRDFSHALETLDRV